jgi:hydrogenase maturation factor
MTRPLPRVGKLDPGTFDEVIFPRLGRGDSSVILGPRHGVDAAVVDLGDRVMVVAEDPTFGLASWGWRRFGWGVVHICAGDVAVMGVKPQYMTICLLLPPATPREVLEEVWQAIHEECDRLGIAIVGGHTGAYGGIPYVLNGGCTVWGFAPRGEVVTPSGARPGDAVIVTKGAAIEAAAILALQYPKTLGRILGPEVVARASDTYWQMSVLEDACAVREAGGATAMHDATEGGVLGGLFEVAHASGCGIRADLGLVPVSAEAAAICRHFDMDPYASISEGTLVATAPGDRADGILAALHARGIQAAIVGEMLPASAGRTVVRPDGTESTLAFPEEDPFWAAFFRTLEEPDV